MISRKKTTKSKHNNEYYKKKRCSSNNVTRMRQETKPIKIEKKCQFKT
jgi:hypothetical protein